MFTFDGIALGPTPGTHCNAHGLNLRQSTHAFKKWMTIVDGWVAATCTNRLHCMLAQAMASSRLGQELIRPF